MAYRLCAALALGPTVLAGWTAPRGDNDGLWTLVFLFLPVLGGVAAVVAAVAERIGSAHRRSPSHPGALTAVTLSDRLAALTIDVVIVGAVLVVPVTALSDAKFEIVAGVVTITVATAYLAVSLSWKGRTLGQSLVGLFVMDTRTNRPVPLVRAFLRNLVVVVEVAVLPTLILAVRAAR